MHFIVEARFGDGLGDRKRLFNCANRIHQQDLVLEHGRLIGQSHCGGNRIMKLSTMQQEALIKHFCLLRITTIDIERDESNE